MRVYFGIVLMLFVLSTLYVMAQEITKKPVLTTQQKLDIRNAQVEMFQAKSTLEATPQYRAFVAAQDHMNEIALRIQRETGADPSKWQFTQDLEYVAVPHPEPAKAEKK